MKTPPPRGAAFSLMEVVIALGLVSFALVGMVGLISISLNSGRESLSDTQLVSMTSSVFSDLRGDSFDQAEQKVLNSHILYFNSEGVGVPAQANALYQCVITGSADPDSRDAAGRANLLRITLTFTRPANAASPTNKQVIHGHLARYR